MKWKERGMAYMNSMNFKYLKYLFKQNKKLLVLLNIILAVIICVIQTTLVNGFGVLGDARVSYTMISSATLGMMISIIVPLFMMKMLYTKKSCDFYYALPMKKKDLFITHVIFGLFVTMLPLILYYGIGMWISYSGISSFEIEFTKIHVVKALFVILVHMFAMQSLINFVSVRCNNVIDALMIIFAYLVIPFVLFITLNTYLSDLVNQFTVGMGTYFDFDFIIENIIYFISVPCAIVFELSHVMSMEPMTMKMIYWIVLAIVMLAFSFRYFIKREAEESEGITKFYLGYPLIIVASVLCVLLFGLALGFHKVIVGIMSILAYVILIFIWKRKIYVNIKIVGIYVLLVAICATLQYSFIQTKGFYSIHEVPKQAYTDGEIHIERLYDNFDAVVLKTHDLEAVLKIKELHQMVVENANEDTDIMVSFIYGKDEAYRHYYISHKTLNEMVMPAMKQLEKNESIIVDEDPEDNHTVVID